MSNEIQSSLKISGSDRRIPPLAFLLTLGIGVVGSNSFALSPIAPEVAQSLQTDVPSVMTASAAFGLGTAGSAIFLARFADSYGPKRVLALALLSIAAGLVGGALANDLPLFVAAQFCIGLAAGIALPAIYALAAIVAPAGRESETIGVVLTGWTLSLVAGVPISAILADFAGWRFVYVVIAAAAIASSASIYWSRVKDDRNKSAAPSPFAAARIPGVLPLLAACAAYMGAFHGIYAYIGGHVYSTLDAPVSASGLIAFSYGLGFGGAALLNWVIDRFDSGRLLPSIFVSISAVYLLIAIAAGSYVGTVFMVFLWGLANHFGLNVLIVRLTSLDPAQRGAIMGLNSGVTYLALFAGTIGMGVLYGRFGFWTLPLTGAGLLALAAGFAVWAQFLRYSPNHS